jgi:hypothetical protein
VGGSKSQKKQKKTVFKFPHTCKCRETEAGVLAGRGQRSGKLAVFTDSCK